MRAVVTGSGAPTDPSTDSLACASSPAPLTCFITDEATMDNARERSSSQRFQHSDQRKQRTDWRNRSSSNRWTSPNRIGGSASSLCETEQDILCDASRPSTPLLTGATESLLSGSPRYSLVELSVDDQASAVTGFSASIRHEQSDEQLDEDSVPQLIMPSVAIPRRRPYSEVGKSLGKLKIMVAGRPGIGKTSLIKSMAQRCEHIVHVESMDAPRTSLVSETYASSKPRPWWRTDIEHLDRRRSSIYEKLDRNICFVECSWRSESPNNLHSGLQYLESQLNELLGKSLDDTDLRALVDAGEEPVVDILLYMIPHEGLEDVDIDFMKRAQAMTNVIPVLARADMLEDEGLNAARNLTLQGIDERGVECFCFNGPESPEHGHRIYAISNATQTDYDVIDASILMGSEYAPPLLRTDLGALVENIFSQEGTARLRHSTALKCMKWRQEHGSGLLPLVLRQQFQVAPEARQKSLQYDPCLQRRGWDRLELFNWAQSLRASLHGERIYHDMIQRVEVLGAERESQVLSIRRSKGEKPRSSHRHPPCSRQQDPLGILELGGRIKQQSRLLLEFLSSLGMIGYVVSYLRYPAIEARNCVGTAASARRLGMEPTGWWLSLS